MNESKTFDDESSFGFYNDFRSAIIISIGSVPIVGGMLSFLGTKIIPEKGASAESKWNKIIDDKISDAIKVKVKQDLIGLSNVCHFYKLAVESGNSNTILTQSIAANTQFSAMVPGFQIQGHEITLLPLFSIVATLHLSLLRDMVLTGNQYGLSEELRSKYSDELITILQQYSNYADKYVIAAIDKSGRENPHGKNQGRRKFNMPLSAMFEAKTYYQLKVLDLKYTWEHFSPIKSTDKPLIKLGRELFTPILGLWDVSKPIPLSLPDWDVPKSQIKSLTIWSGEQWKVNCFFGFELEYMDGNRLFSGKKKMAEERLNFNGVIDAALIYSGSGVNGIQLKSEGRTSQVGTHEEGVDVFNVSFPGHKLSSIHSMGEGGLSAQGAISGLVLGFQLINQGIPKISKDTVGIIAPTLAPRLQRWLIND